MFSKEEETRIANLENGLGKPDTSVAQLRQTLDDQRRIIDSLTARIALLEALPGAKKPDPNSLNGPDEEMVRVRMNLVPPDMKFTKGTEYGSISVPTGPRRDGTVPRAATVHDQVIDVPRSEADNLIAARRAVVVPLTTPLGVPSQNPEKPTDDPSKIFASMASH